ncbi:MAG: bifunctional 5,10-methylenetetrahydrofolate dehydrogenase/5,10-methenyltetrahydrofolate cyclohydrolase, partial [Rickettsiales bacterium]|nr:bifunctional 5,10-methylenetetrahydrofolate dehydrogenase/5,10-methenyltetrahydrofolate cyclohydrolase [Rickettsiales bacterium]
MILDGKSLSDKIADELKCRAANLDIKLAVILVGDNPASIKYVNAKRKRAIEIGIKCEISSLPTDVSETELLKLINEFNNDDSISGLMIQLPLPEHINQANVTRAINPDKDVDGLNPASGFMPATVLGIERLLENYKIDLAGRVAVVVGRSEIVGKPAARMLLNHDATVIICHSRTRDLAAFTRQADILVSAVGIPNLITPEHIKNDVVIIDAGTIGDVQKSCYEKAAAYTPVPGGVGPMTIISLMENTIQSAEFFCHSRAGGNRA